MLTLEASGSQNLRGIAFALDGDLRQRARDLGQIGGGQRKVRGGDVLLKPRQLCRSGDRHDPRPLGENPRKGHLCGCRIFVIGDATQQIDQCLVGLHRLRCKARQPAPEITLVPRVIHITG